MDTKMLSTTQVANILQTTSSEMFSILSQSEWIKRNGERWELTTIGEKKGGKLIKSEKYGDYVAWPEYLIQEISLLIREYSHNLVTATILSEKLKITAQRLNLIFSELGWMEKDIRGWKITKLGKSVGGIQKEHTTAGTLFLIWPKNIIENKAFKESIEQISIIESKDKYIEQKHNNDSFREKFPAEMRTQDGHYVRSKAEMIIDNQLYQYEVVHAYERKLPLEDEIYCDFYLPNKKVYIEYWGLEDDEKYKDRKDKKLQIYRREDLNLIELTDKDIKNLDDVLPRMLLKFGVKVY